jgi:tetratricopeptide (TPR) repeat protein
VRPEQGMLWQHGSNGNGTGGTPVSKKTPLRQLLKDLDEKGMMRALWNAASLDEGGCLSQLHALVASADRNVAGVKVESIVDRILKAQPDAALFWVYKSELRLAAADWKTALETARRAIELDPRDADGWLNMGLAAYELGLYTDCSKYLTVSYELNPRPKVIMEMGITQYRIGNRAAGIKLLETAYQKASDDPDVIEAYGWHLYYVHLKERALSILDEGVAYWPTRPKIRMFAALSASGSGLKDRATRIIEPLMPSLYSGELRGDLVGFALLVLLETDQIEPGIRIVAAYSERGDMDDVFQYNAACVMCRSGRLKEARAYLKKALDQDTGWVRELAKTDPDLQDLRNKATAQSPNVS